MRPPPPCARIRAAAAWQHRKVPVVFTRRTRSQSSSVSSSSRLMVMIPALLTRTSTRSAAAEHRGHVLGVGDVGLHADAAELLRRPCRHRARCDRRARRARPRRRSGRRCPCRSRRRRRSRRRSCPSKRDMGGDLLVTGAGDGGVPRGDPVAARGGRLGGLVELARAVERLELRLAPEARARGRPGARPRARTAPRRASARTARPPVSAWSCISVRLAVGPPSASSVCTGPVERLDGGHGVLDLEGDRLERRARELRRAGWRSVRPLIRPTAASSHHGAARPPKAGTRCTPSLDAAGLRRQRGGRRAEQLGQPA